MERFFSGYGCVGSAVLAQTGGAAKRCRSLSLSLSCEFGELGVEIGGDFGDLLEDLESLVFEVDGAEAGADPIG